jgi:hypothetical protein
METTTFVIVGGGLIAALFLIKLIAMLHRKQYLKATFTAPYFSFSFEARDKPKRRP